MGKLIYFISAILISVASAYSVNPSGYEWWFDNDISSVTIGSFSSDEADIIIDTSELPKGVHYFNCRLNTGDGEYGSIFRKMFFLTNNSHSSQEELTYEYWLDNDYIHKTTGNLTQGTASFEINLGNVNPGVYYFNCRLNTGDGEYGSIFRKMFFLTNNSHSSQEELTYEYWLDNDYIHKTTGNLTQGTASFEINLGNVNPGVYYFNCRLYSDDNGFGSIYRQMLLVTGEGVNATNYEYWIDDNYDAKVIGNVIPGENSYHINMDNFPKGLHRFNYRLCDQNGEWGAPFSKYFFYTSQNNPLLGYRYFINGRDFGYVTLPPQENDSYLFDIQLPDDMRISISEMPLIFKGDNVSVRWSDTLNCMIQLKSEEGWGSPQQLEVMRSNDFSTDAVFMEVNTKHTFTTPHIGEFAAVTFNASSAKPLYFRADIPIALDIYNQRGSKVTSIAQSDLLEMKSITLSSGAYYGILRDAIDQTDQMFTFHIMDLPNQSPKPVVLFNQGTVTLQCSREDAEIYYTIDGTDPREVGIRYTEPFVLTHNVLVKAISIVPNSDILPSDVEEFEITYFTVETPQWSFDQESNLLTLGCSTPGAVISYAVNARENWILYDEPVLIENNCTVYAKAEALNYLESEIVEIVFGGFKVDTPQLSFDQENKLLTLACSTPGAVISYAVNAPENWILYDEPVLIENNCTVYAKAEAPNYLESEIAEIVIDEFKCAEVNISYNGRYITLSSAEPDAEILYSLDGSNPVNGEVYADTFDVGALATVKAVAVKSDFMNSDLAEYNILGYADEVHAETAMEGVLESCFGWTEEGYLQRIGNISIEGRLNADDYSLIRTMEALRHLDIEKVEEAVIPRKVFAETSLLSISLPASIESIGDSILRNNPQLCAVIWNDVDMTPDSIALKGITNRNLLLYLPNHDRADGNLGLIRNVIEEGRAESIVLTEGYPFYAPREFDADYISYVRNFSKRTEIGVCSGWETLALPFDVERISDALGEITPFAVADEADRPFWLYKPVGTGWERTGEIRAYEPYLISMPNNPDYIESLNIRGDVNFEAVNVRVEATPEPSGYLYKGDIELWPNFASLAADELMWVVNDDWYESELPGSNFVRGLRDVRPFECFATSEIASQRMPIFDQSDVDGLLADMGMKIWCENHDLCILSGMSRKVRIYDTVGQLVRVAEVQAGVICRVHDLAPGIYLVADQKIMVK